MSALALLLALAPFVVSPPATPVVPPPLALVRQDPQDPVDPNLAQFQNLTLGMKFNYPKGWERIVNKKGESRLIIPIENSSNRGVVEVSSVSFRSEPERWQVMEAAFAKSKRRTVEKQWQEEILSVPLLLTRVSYTENGNSLTSVTGLIYTLGFNKMMYRVTASPEEFDKVEYQWRQVLQSLRTWDGEMPKPEDPTVKIARSDPKAQLPGKPVDDVPHPQVPHLVSGEPKPPKFITAPKAATVELGGKKIELHLPSDWSATAGEGNSFTLKNAGVAGPVSITLYPAAGSDPAAMALFKLSGKTLDEFAKVGKRDETLPVTNRAGQPVAQIWRAGTSAKGNLFTCEACGFTTDYYWLLTYRTEAALRYPAERKLIESLLDRISIEPAP